MSPERKPAKSPDDDLDRTVDMGSRSKPAAGKDADRTLDLGSGSQGGRGMGMRRGGADTPQATVHVPGADATRAGSRDATIAADSHGLDLSGDSLPSPENLIGSVVGPYKIMQKLGEGGMGYVLKALDLHLNRFVALKLLHPHLARNQNFAHQFKIEAEALAKLDHPNIVNVYNFGSTGGVCYFAMQFIRGYELTKLLKEQGQIAPRRVVELMRPVVEGLTYIHGYGILHRDLKPQNIMIDETTGRPIVTDFGLAKMDVDIVQRRMDPDGKLRIDASNLDEASLVGTPAYMAPELVASDIYKGEPAQADVYAVGVILYQLVTGVLPFQGRTVAEIFERALTQELTPIAAYTTSPPPPGLVRVINKALARDPRERYATMERLLGDLRTVEREWTDAEQIQEKARLGREMALAMSSGAVGRHRRESPFRKIGIYAVLGIAALALGWLVLKPGGEEGKTQSSAKSGLGSRAGDLSWPVGEIVRVSGYIDSIEEDESDTLVGIAEPGDEGRVAVFQVPAAQWTQEQSRFKLALGQRIVLAGRRQSGGAEDEFNFAPAPDFVLPVSHATVQIETENGLKPWGRITADEIERRAVVTGTIVAIVEATTEGGAAYFDLHLAQSLERADEGDEEIPDLVVSCLGRLPRSSHQLDARVGDMLTAYGLVFDAEVVEAEAKDIDRSLITNVGAR